MRIIIHPHAIERIKERGIRVKEVMETVGGGDRFRAKFDRVGFRKNFIFRGAWQGTYYETKQVEVYGVREKGNFIVITAIARYF